MKIDDTFINSRSMLKCCAMSLLRLAEENPHIDYPNGAVVMCRTGRKSHKLMLLNNVWRWVDPQAAELEERERLRKEGKLYDHVRGRNRD